MARPQNRTLSGVGASPGIAIGVAYVIDKHVEVGERRIAPEEVDDELRRFDQALIAADAQLARIQRQIAEREGEDQYRILEAHRLMLGDVHLVEPTRRFIREDLAAAEWALRRALDQIRAVFDRIEDPYFRDRRSDVDMVGERLIRVLVGVGDLGQAGEIPKGVVVVGHDLSPADAAQLRKAGVVAFCSEAGGKTSHTAIVCRALGLPYVVGLECVTRHVRTGSRLIVDGGGGQVIVDPDDAAVARYAARAARELARAERLRAMHDKPAVTREGVTVHLAANVELLEEIPIAVELGAQSIGLFRTEFLYLDRPTLPSEEEQLQHAVGALRQLGGAPATFRTLDLGGDKLPAAVQMPSGMNPVLGLRSIRYSLHRPDVFRIQLRALYRASALGPVRILFPLISGVAELRAAKALCQEVCAELTRDGLPHDPRVPVGVMIETPSAALIADLLALECDFLSIGTNDLIQYSLAADRENEHVGYLYHPLHPAILRLIKQAVDGARRSDTALAMCGDMAGDPAFAWMLLGLGLRDFSMAPRQIPIMKSVIRATRLADAERLAARAMELRTETEVEDLVYGVMRKQFPIELSEEENERSEPVAAAPP